MGNPYGKTALTATITLPNLDKYLEKVEAAGNNIDDACKEAVNAATPIVYKTMKEGAARHRKGAGKYGTDAVYNAIEANPAKQNGNFIYGTIGIDMEKHPKAKSGVYEEYGDGHSPEFPDPFVRPAFDDHKKEIRAAERAVLKKKGVPVD
ncbi:MAG TPA: hypothetical protein DG942_00630 [Ruminococcaceae bacterium]|nr:hypothetical protein [Oscillospiraceae bacterium]HCW79592.1 hypothetical protein [Oscillospiraceae bacterium]